jgi:TrkA domain protein
MSGGSDASAASERTMSDATGDRPLRSTQLPGVGERHDFATGGGETIGVVRHRDGDREVLVFSKTDRDACTVSLRLSGEDARRLAALLSEERVERSR